MYPDTLCWVRDFSHAYNEPLTRMYSGTLPTVITPWSESLAAGQMPSAFWRTELLNKHLSSNRRSAVHDYRLPTEFEWNMQPGADCPGEVSLGRALHPQY